MPDADDVSRNLSPREQLLSTASRIFYEEGINAIGVDRVLSEAGVTRSTLYRYFDGKMGLVEAYLRREDEVIRGYFSAASAEATSPRHLMELLITGIADDASRYHRRGCPFINAAAEFPLPSGPVRRIVTVHRDWFRDALQTALLNMGLPDADSRARTLVLLRDAALVGGYLDGVEHVRRTFLASARREATLD
ncbi:TetR/AcrR family transcriptional regulator [Curtobacterium flaccumfaciens]|uniref:TetR/AcrR family transcriptional regulator n=1 Tax=Curtobacterium flaccumfaciens TaxID=2035 RepID=UPI00399665FF